MASRDEELTVLSRGLEQAASVLDSVGETDPDAATPCADWSVSELVDHLVVSPARFAAMVRGDEVSWSTPTPHAGERPGDEFRQGADALMEAWRAVGDGDAPTGPDWQCAEIAVHTYDLVTALGGATGELDPEVAEHGLGFMQANLTPEVRGPAFGPEQPAPAGADAYQRIAALAGRTVDEPPAG